MTDHSPVQPIDEDECWLLLRNETLARMAFQVGGVLEIFPINYAVDGRRIVFRSAPGSKLAGALIAQDVAIEIDHVGAHVAWSVVVHGTCRTIDHEDELAELADLDLTPIIPTVKREFVELAPTRVSGRRFVLGPEPQSLPEGAA